MSETALKDATAEAEAEPDENEGEDGHEDGEEEEATDEAEAEAEAEAEPPVQAKSQKEIEVALSKLEAEAARHAKRVQEIMGDDFDTLVPCPIDFTPGFVMYVPGQSMPPETREALEALYGDEALPEYLPDPQKETCPTCGGWGETLTGGKGAAKMLGACSSCGGNGWQTKVQAYVPSSTEPQSLNANAPTAPSTPTGLPPKPEPYFNPATQTWELPTP